MSDILCSAGGHEAGSQPATCSWCEFHNGFVEQLTYVPHSAVIFGNPLLKPVYIAEMIIISAVRSRLGRHSRFKLRNVGYVLVNRALEELPHAEDPLVKSLTQTLVYQEIKELPKQRREAASPEEAAREVDS